MIRLLVVDDEASIRQGLKQAVRWPEYGVQIVGEAQSGKEALQKARLLQPDIVITDIRLLEENGLSLVKKLPEILPSVRIIILSRHSDVQYMIEAMKNGVRDYLLKPASSLEILASVIKLRDEILLEDEKRKQDTHFESLVSESMNALKAQFFEELLLGRLDDMPARERARKLGIILPGPQYTLILFRPKAGKVWELSQLIASQFEQFHPVIHRREDGLVASILNVERVLDQAKLDALLECLEGLREPMTLPTTGVCESLAMLGVLREACEKAQACSIWFGPARCLHVRGGQMPKSMMDCELLPLERKIVLGMRSGNSTALTESVETLFQKMKDARPPRAQFQTILLGVAHSIEVISEDSGLHETLKELFATTYTVDQVKAAIFERINGGYSQYRTLVRSALTYMSKHFATKLLLSDVAQVIYISPSYLTRLLKKETGRGFKDWLHLIRINNAKELLEHSSLHHYEIAERVGYGSYKIFSEYFSKLVGMNARSYFESVTQMRSERRIKTN